MFIILIGLLLLGNVFSAVLWEEEDLAYQIILKQFGKCRNEGLRTFRIENVKIKRLDRFRSVMNCSAIITRPMNNTDVDVDVSSFTGGKWKDHFFYTRVGDMCTKGKLVVPTFFKNVLRSSKINRCPFPVGNHTITNMDLTLDYSLPYMVQGLYRVELIFKQKEITIGCSQMLLDVINKEKKRTQH